MAGTPSFGIDLYGYQPRDIVNLAIHAERLGFEGLWIGEHYVIPEQYVGHHPSRTTTPADQHDARDDAILGHHVILSDPWQLIAAAAAVTTRLMLGTAITIVPMMHPLLLARAAVTSHNLSGGRIRMGGGAGWLREEFDAYGIPFEGRGSRLDESVEILRKACAGGFFNHEGKNFKFSSVQITPTPARIPVICGGNTPLALRRAARDGDGWINSSRALPLEDAVELRDALEKERQAQGVAGRPFTYFVRPTLEAKEIENFVREGFDNLVLGGPTVWPNDARLTLADKIAGLERIARDLGMSPAPKATA